MALTQKFRLSPSTFVEPLVNKWPAWSYVLSPIPASLHLVKYQLSVLESYLAGPEIHIAAARDPTLVTGPFMNIPPDRLPEVEALLKETKNKQAKNILLADAFTKLVSAMTERVHGECLEPLYENIPASLRGCVELVYDYHDRPTVRVLERLLYDSECYDTTLQSYRLRTLKSDRSRTFIFNTPVLSDPSELEWNIPFASEIADELFKLDLRPRAMGDILDILSGAGASEGTLLPFVTSEPLACRRPWKEAKIKLSYIGHACVLVEWGGVSILTDACIPVQPLEDRTARMSFSDLPERLDFVIITHNHQDHYVLETLLRLRHRIDCLLVPRSYGLLCGDLSLRILSEKLGFHNVKEMDTLESVSFPGGCIIGIPFFGEHADLAHGKIAYVVRCGEEQILFAADSDCISPEMYERIRKCIGCVQTVFLSVENVGAPLSWVNSPLFPKQPNADIEQQRRYHACDAGRALQMLEALGAQRLYTYAMGLEPWMEHLLGLNMTKDSVQWSESERVLRYARGRGFRTGVRLSGSTTLFLSPSLGLSAPPDAPDGETRHQYWAQQVQDAMPCIGDLCFEKKENLTMAKKQLRPLRIPGSSEAGQSAELEDTAAACISSVLSSLRVWTNTVDFCVVVGSYGDATNRNKAERISYIFPLRVDLSQDPTFEQLTQRVRRGVEEARLQMLDQSRMLRIVRDIFGASEGSGICLGFAFDWTEAHGVRLGLEELKQLCDLMVSVTKINGTVSGSVAYEVPLVEHLGIDIAAQFSRVWETAVRAPHSPISTITEIWPNPMAVERDHASPDFSF